MLRDLNQAYPGGMRRMGLCATGVLGSAIPSSGGTSPGLIYPSLALPADADKEYAYWFEEHTFPAGALTLDDFSAGTLPGLPAGTYTATVRLEEWGVSLGTFPWEYVVGEAPPTISATLAVQEPNADTFSATVTAVPVLSATLAFAETGADVFSAAATVVPVVSATLAFAETGEDTFSATVQLVALVNATLAYTEPAGDVFSAIVTPELVLSAWLAYAEPAGDVFSGQAFVMPADGVTGRYASQADMVARFGFTEMVQLTDKTNTATAIDIVVMGNALEDADAEIDARLQARYSLPLQSVPRLLVNIACDIARYRLYDDRATDQVTRRYEDALKSLDRISSGALQLGLDQVVQTTPQNGGPSFEAGDRIFSRDRLADYTGDA